MACELHLDFKNMMAKQANSLKPHSHEAIRTLLGLCHPGDKNERITFKPH